jgi:hypothetical protein
MPGDTQEMRNVMLLVNGLAPDSRVERRVERRALRSDGS